MTFATGPTTWRVEVFDGAAWTDVDCHTIEAVTTDRGGEVRDSILPTSGPGTLTLTLTGGEGVRPWPWPGAPPWRTIGCPIRVTVAATVSPAGYQPVFTGEVVEWNVTPFAGQTWTASIMAADATQALRLASLPSGLYFDSPIQAQVGEAHTGPLAAGAWLPTAFLNEPFHMNVGGPIQIGVSIGQAWCTTAGPFEVFIDAGPAGPAGTTWRIDVPTTYGANLNTYFQWQATLPAGDFLARVNIRNAGAAQTDFVTRQVFAFVEVDNVTVPSNPFPVHRLGPSIANLHRRLPGWEATTMDVGDLPAWASWQQRRTVLDGGRLTTSEDAPGVNLTPGGSYWRQLDQMARSALAYVFCRPDGALAARHLPIFDTDPADVVLVDCLTPPAAAPDDAVFYDELDLGVDFVALLNRVTAQRQADFINAQVWRYTRVDQASIDAYGPGYDFDFGDLTIHEPTQVQAWVEDVHRAGWGSPRLRCRSVTIHHPDVSMATVRLMDTVEVRVMTAAAPPVVVFGYVAGIRWDIEPGLARVTFRLGLTMQMPAGAQRPALSAGRSLPPAVLEAQVKPYPLTGGVGPGDSSELANSTTAAGNVFTVAGDIVANRLFIKDPVAGAGGYASMRLYHDNNVDHMALSVLDLATPGLQVYDSRDSAFILARIARGERVVFGNGYAPKWQGIANALGITPATAFTRFPLAVIPGTEQRGAVVQPTGLYAWETGLYDFHLFILVDRNPGAIEMSCKVGAINLAYQYNANANNSWRFQLSGLAYLAAGQYLEAWWRNTLGTIAGGNAESVFYMASRF